MAQIVVLDDNYTNCVWMMLILKRGGYYGPEICMMESTLTQLMGDGVNSGLALMLRERPALIILDGRMPDEGDWYRFAAFLRGHGFAVPIMVVSLQPDDMSERAIQEGTINAFCLRPTDLNPERPDVKHLLATVGRLLAG